MIPKFKAKQPAGTRLMGTFVDDEQWVTNGHWAARAYLVGGLTTEQISAFAVGKGWRETAGGPFVEEEKGVSLDMVLQTTGLDLIECKASLLSIGDKKGRYGFTIDADNVLQTYQWDYLAPITEFQLKTARGKNSVVYAYAQDDMVACVFPMRLDSPSEKEFAENIEKFRVTKFPAWQGR